MPILVICAFLLAFVVGRAQETYNITFDKQPPFMSWAKEWHDQNHDRVFRNGSLEIDNRVDNNAWFIRYWAYDPRFPWSASLTYTIDQADGSDGFGVVALSGDVFLLYKIQAAARTYWIGTWKQNGNVWTNVIKQQPDGKYERFVEAIKPLGQRNELSISVKNNSMSFLINGVEVDQHPLSGPLAPFSGVLGGLGVFYSSTVKGRMHTFASSYTSRDVKQVKNAFIGVRKSYVKELEGPGSRYPVMSPNGQQLYYVRSDSVTSDDAWVADALTDSTWSVGRPVGKPINNATANNVVSVSQDGNELLLWGQYNPDGSFKASGFSTSRRTASGWSPPSDINTNHAPSKSKTREECLSADRSVVILAREIEGNTTGDKDLYVSFRMADGSYGPLTNLGTNVNTIGSENGPFLAADNRTLYWYSYHDTFGDADIFVSKRLDDTWLNWSPRVNLGPTINTVGWDAYFCIHPSGRYAYMNTSDGYTQGICRVDLPNDAATRALLPDPVVIVKGRVLHAKTKQPLGVEIRYDDLATNKNIGTAVSEPKEGRYSVVLTGGRSYGFYASLDGFFPVSDNIELLDLKQYQVVERDLYLEPIAVGAKIRLNNLFFDTDKSELRPESTAELDRLIALLRTRSTITITIDGHTDDRGTDAHNNKLSTDRAASVMAYLVKSGIAPERLTSKGYGKAKPVAKGTSDAARRQNRRVEFSITSI